MSKHTPGPWALIGSTLVQDSGNRLHLGTFVEAPGLGGAAAANAKLIVGAPELFEALAEFVGHMDAVAAKNGSALYVPLDSGIVKAARAAIAKAQGQGQGQVS